MAKQQINQQQVKLTARQTGYDYITVSTSSATLSKAVTFSTAFAAAPKVLPGVLGFTTTTPTSIASFTGVYSNNPSVFITSITTTGFTINITGTAVFGAVSYVGFTWTAESF